MKVPRWRAAVALTLVCAFAKPSFAIDPAIQAIRNAVVHIGRANESNTEVEKWHGTGFVVTSRSPSSPDTMCIVMTAKHVIAGKDRKRLVGAFQLAKDRARYEFMPAEVIDDAAEKDIALLRLRGSRTGKLCTLESLLPFHPLVLDEASDIHQFADEAVMLTGGGFPPLPLGSLPGSIRPLVSDA